MYKPARNLSNGDVVAVPTAPGSSAVKELRVTASAKVGGTVILTLDGEVRREYPADQLMVVVSSATPIVECPNAQVTLDDLPDVVSVSMHEHVRAFLADILRQGTNLEMVRFGAEDSWIVVPRKKE